MGLILGCSGASWGLWWASWGYVGRLGCHPGGNGSICQFVFPLLGRSGSPLGALLGRLGGLLARLGALLGASWALLARSWGPLGPFWSAGKTERRERQNPSKTNRKSMILASRGPLGRPLGGLLGRLGGLLARLGAILGVLEHLGAIFRPLGALLERLGGLLGLSWRLRGPQGCV